ncbi:methyltransferase type 11 [Halovivax asiaticus JCM 14624]|uniref:Methyltransferase type 11 n=1 Tax=Halovivax asiaticus JCM 14624 TaxID=1227490 RepID=M0BJA4_9EURY|nr:class I SAM-dependent methyltransferase [Halovivax asiaticus]ELZ10935.1 methyltransferase type 11 [Halovivax asiaticus JCM 14624]
MVTDAADTAEPAEDALGLAMWDYQQGRDGTLRYRDGLATKDGNVEEFYFTPPAEWADDRIAQLKRLTDSGGPVLDVGCGTGQHVRWVRDHDVDAVGIDVSSRAVATARERGTRQVLVGDMFTLPFGRDRFRAINCSGTQLGLGGSLAGIADVLDRFARVTTDDALALVDNYDPRELDSDFFGYRPDPREGIAHRCFHFEYERATTAPGLDAIGRSLHFLLCSPDRLREATAGTPWRVDEVFPTNDGTFYRALLERVGKHTAE